MCESHESRKSSSLGVKTVPVDKAVGTVLAHDITEIRPGEFKGRAFKKGHVVQNEDICHLQRLGKDNLFILEIGPDEMHEDDAACAVAAALMGEGVRASGGPREGKIDIVTARDGLLKIDVEALREFNMLGDLMCATMHTNTVVKAGQAVAGTRAIPLVVKRDMVDKAMDIASSGVVSVKSMRRPRAGIIVTGNEVYYGRIKDAFAPIIEEKIKHLGGEVVGVYFAPDDVGQIEQRLRELLMAGADLLITTGGMSVDPDDVTRYAIRKLVASDVAYGSAVLPGAMILAAYIESPETTVPVLGIPACAMYHRTTVFDLVLPRVLAGEHIGRTELAEYGHGGLCLKCEECRYPVCPFGK